MKKTLKYSQFRSDVEEFIQNKKDRELILSPFLIQNTVQKSFKEIYGYEVIITEHGIHPDDTIKLIHD